MILHEKIAAQLPDWRERMRLLAKEHAEVVVDRVTIGQIVGGMRDIKALLTDVSWLGASVPRKTASILRSSTSSSNEG